MFRFFVGRTFETRSLPDSASVTFRSNRNRKEDDAFDVLASLDTPDHQGNIANRIRSVYTPLIPCQIEGSPRTRLSCLEVSTSARDRQVFDLTLEMDGQVSPGSKMMTDTARIA